MDWASRTSFSRWRKCIRGAHCGTAWPTASKAGNTDLADRVFPGRELPAAVESLIDEGPLALVYTRRERIKPEDYPASGFDGAVRRTVDLCIDVAAVGSFLVDDKLDDLAEQIEALLEDWTPDGMAGTEIRLVETEVDSTDAFEQPVGGMLLTFEAKYWKEFRKDTSRAIARAKRGSANETPAELVATCSGNCDCTDCAA
jgi:hypothetical protein